MEEQNSKDEYRRQLDEQMKEKKRLLEQEKQKQKKQDESYYGHSNQTSDYTHSAKTDFTGTLGAPQHDTERKHFFSLGNQKSALIPGDVTDAQQDSDKKRLDQECYRRQLDEQIKCKEAIVERERSAERVPNDNGEYYGLWNRTSEYPYSTRSDAESAASGDQNMAADATHGKRHFYPLRDERFVPGTTMVTDEQQDHDVQRVNQQHYREQLDDQIQEKKDLVQKESHKRNESDYNSLWNHKVDYLSSSGIDLEQDLDRMELNESKKAGTEQYGLGYGSQNVSTYDSPFSNAVARESTNTHFESEAETRGFGNEHTTY